MSLRVHRGTLDVIDVTWSYGTQNESRVVSHDGLMPNLQGCHYMGASRLSQSKSSSLVPLLDLRLSQRYTFPPTPIQTGSSAYQKSFSHQQ